jgi:nucleoside-diphosphate-sugar epimerase
MLTGLEEYNVEDIKTSNMGTVLITGGAGYIGSWVVQRLLGHGYKVVVFDTLLFGPRPLQSFLGHPNYLFIKGDVRNSAEVDAAMKGVDYVAHLAAIVGEAACNKDSDAARSINMDGTANVARAAAKNDVRRLVFFSTCSSYGVQDTSVMADEQTPVNPVSLYAETKIDGEKLLWNELSHSDVAGTIFRPSTVHGSSPRMRFDLIVNHFVKDAFFNKQLGISGPDMWRPLMWVGDAGKAIELAFQADPEAIRNQVFNMGGLDGNSRKREIGEIIKKKYMPGLDLEIHDSDPDIRSYRVDFNKINKRLGFTLSKTLDEAIGDLFDLLNYGIIADPNDAMYRNA